MQNNLQAGVYNNPIIQGFNPDPSFARCGSDIFLITSSFEYFPGIPIYHSTDLISWKLIGHALTRRSQLDLRTCEPGGGIWASTIRYRAPGTPGGGEDPNGKGRWYICTCKWDRYRPQADDRVWPRGFYVWTDNIWDSSSWSDPIFFDQPGFDQDLFWDDDGAVYLSSTYRMHKDDHPSPKMKSFAKNFAIHVSEIDLATGAAKTAPKMVRASLHDPGVSEGSHIIKRGEYYYLFTAEGGTEGGHAEWCFRSQKGALGPWEERPGKEGLPLWYNSANEEVQCTGHADLLEDINGNWWAVFLGIRPIPKGNSKWESFSPFGRETFLVPVTWDEDNWPVFNYGRNVVLKGIASPGLYQLQASHDWTDDFSNGPELALGWYHKKTPVKKYWVLSPSTGLSIYGGCHGPSSPESSALLLRKQTTIDGIWSTLLDFTPTRPRCEAGAILWWNYFCYASIGIRKPTPDKREIALRVPLDGKGNFDSSSFPLSHLSGPLLLAIKCTSKGKNGSHEYHLGFAELLKDSTDVESIEIRWVVSLGMELMTQNPPVGMAFCGMMMGLYSYGDMEPVLEPAQFRYAKWLSAS